MGQIMYYPKFQWTSHIYDLILLQNILKFVFKNEVDQIIWHQKETLQEGQVAQYQAIINWRVRIWTLADISPMLHSTAAQTDSLPVDNTVQKHACHFLIAFEVSLTPSLWDINSLR